MNKWLILLAAVAITGGSYYLLSQAKDKRNIPSSAMDVEDFDTPEDGPDPEKNETAYDMLDDPEGTQAQMNASEGHEDSHRPTNAADIETIDDADDPGETVKDPVVIEDRGEAVEPQPVK